MSRFRFFLRLLLVPTLATAGTLLGRAGEGGILSSVVLFWEPLGWVLGTWSIWRVWAAGDRTLSIGLLLGGLAASFGVHGTAAEAEPAGNDAAPFVSRMRACVRSLQLPPSGFRLATWAVEPGDDAGLPTALADAQPDVAVVFGTLRAPVVEAIAAAVGGETSAFAGEEAPIHVFSRGTFAQCGQDEAWSDRPAPGTELGLVYVSLESGTTFPLLVGRFPEVGAVPGWAHATADARAGLRATIDALQSSLLVLALHVPAPLAAPRLRSTLLAAGQSALARPLNWPAPLPLHALDQVWGAEAWVSRRVEARTGAGLTAGVFVDAEPRWPAALPAPADDDPVR